MKAQLPCPIAARRALISSQILEKLQAYSPTVVSTVFLNLHTPSSDIDIVCSHACAIQFSHDLNKALKGQNNVTIKRKPDCILGRFILDDIPFEIYSSTQPVNLQFGYRHFKIMEKLTALGGQSFCNAIRKLKLTGLKTEPAICKWLNIEGDPYSEILILENLNDRELKKRLNQAYD
ncbi:DUF4269 domain-containing protein [Sessilibacter corallicola]|uniref:DUF4269 domain-containing protein n=1 Tax=Sessilibacter corallicola TaxID=2904075 RepID=UPI001E53958F|nr:DUF4269 domain-containing protein [Sessilibacter corallicola]MCE2028350.1 DUF4269 domain-containing protein [Sessilibacter corallicola]